jgi:hypothetical protein
MEAKIGDDVNSRKLPWTDRGLGRINLREPVELLYSLDIWTRFIQQFVGEG